VSGTLWESKLSALVSVSWRVMLDDVWAKSA